MEKVQSNNPYKSTTLFPGFPAGDCSIEMQHCVFEANNIVDFNQVQTLEECRLLCEDTSECQYFTFYDYNYYSSLLSGSCFLFSQCKVYPDYAVDNGCTGDACITVDTACSAVPKECLSAPMKGHMGENLISVHPKIDDELSCRSLCQVEDQCNFFTYFGLNDQSYPETCFLLSTLQEPFTPLGIKYGNQDFVTGTRKCLNNSHCELMVAGKNTTSPSLMFNDVSDYSSPGGPVNAIAVGTCSLTVVAVGGGGDGCDTCGGGGSGYVEWEQISIKGSLMLEV